MDFRTPPDIRIAAKYAIAVALVLLSAQADAVEPRVSWGWRKRANGWRGCTNPRTAAKRLRSETANRCIDRGCTPVGDWMRLRVGDRVRAIGPEVPTQRLAQFDMRLVAKLVERGRARWTGVRLIGKVT